MNSFESASAQRNLTSTLGALECGVARRGIYTVLFIEYEEAQIEKSVYDRCARINNALRAVGCGNPFEGFLLRLMVIPAFPPGVQCDSALPNVNYNNAGLRAVAAWVPSHPTSKHVFGVCLRAYPSRRRRRMGWLRHECPTRKPAFVIASRGAALPTVAVSAHVVGVFGKLQGRRVFGVVAGAFSRGMRAVTRAGGSLIVSQGVL